MPTEFFIYIVPFGTIFRDNVVCKYDGDHKEGPKCRNLSLDEQLRRVTQEMHGAEEALVASGFSLEQWMLIKKYVG
jgi:hypothetical protein